MRYRQKYRKNFKHLHDFGSTRRAAWVLPLNFSQPVLLQVSVGLAELMHAEPTASVGGERGGMHGFQHEVSIRVDERPFALGIIPPQHEHEMFFSFGQQANHGVRERFPTFILVGTGLMGTHGQRGVE